MRNLFRYDNSVMQVLGKITDCICISLLWLIASLPVVTLGASSTAMYYAVNRCVRRGEGGIWGAFWKSFRENFKQATTLGLILTALYVVLFASCYSGYIMYTADKLPGFVFIFLVIVTCIVTMWAEYLLPCLARFNNTITQTLRSCALIALMNIPASVLQLVILAATALAVLIYPLAIVVVPAGGTLLNCYILERIFVKYMSAEDRKKEELIEPEKGS